MSRSVEGKILYVDQQVMLYASYAFVSCGLIGNMLNLITFTFVKAFRGNPSVFYLTMESIVDCGTLLLVYVLRIMSYGFNYDPLNQSVFFCKLRGALLQLFVMVSLTTICFEAIDQYLSTSHNSSHRRRSTLRVAQRLTIINVTVWLVHSIPFAIFYEILPTMVCDISNRIFRQYFSIVYVSFLNGLLPLLIAVAFSTFAFRNIRRIVRQQVPIARRRLDRQMTAMILCRVAFLVVVSVPYGIYLLYILNTSPATDDTLSVTIVKLCSAITSSLFYLNYGGSCYLFLLTSQRFRNQTKRVLIKICLQGCCSDTRNDAIPYGNRVRPMSIASSDA